MQANRGHVRLILLCLWFAIVGCRAHLPALPPGITLQPGRYLTAVFQAPEFVPDQAAYSLETFTVDATQGVEAGTFQALLRTELTRALEANGLKQEASQEACRLSGSIQLAALRGTRLRFIFGSISVELIVSGTITRGEEILFAFQDRVKITSPTRAGTAAPKEVEILLRQAVQTFAAHLLNELLLRKLPPEG